MDRFWRAMDEEMKMNTGGIVGGLIHKGDARGGQHQFEQSTGRVWTLKQQYKSKEFKRELMWHTWSCPEPLAIGYIFFLRNHHPLALKYNTLFRVPPLAALYVLTFSTFAASANFSTNNFFASAQTRACSLSGNSNKEGRRSALNCSDASLGSRVGR
jgi:hypothetical protein